MKTAEAESLYNLTMKHYEEIGHNLELCDSIAKIKEGLKEDSITEINLLSELSAEEPDTSRIFACLLGSRKNVILKKFVADYLGRAGFDFEVKRPVITAEKKYRIDILVEDDDYAIIIENKLLGAAYQRNQLARYIRRMEGEGYDASHIFIVIIPGFYYDGYLQDIRKSVWKLPPDWDKPNGMRHCAWQDAYCCRCDNTQEKEYEARHCHKPEKDCIDYRQKYLDRTIVLDNRFADWLTECAETIDREEILLHSALVQFSDYVKLKYNLKQSKKYIMEMQEFLKSKLVDESKEADANWRVVNEKLSQLNDMKAGLESLRRNMSKDMINRWRDNMLAKNWKISSEDRKSFGMKINGVWCGCWSGCEGEGKNNKDDQPYWGFYSDHDINEEQKTMIEDILETAGMKNSVSKGHGFVVWNNTLNGDTRCNALYEAARKLGYIQ